MQPIIILGLFGFAYGVVLQRSGFCFARAAFELFLLRTREAAAGVVAGLLVATVGFGVVTLLRMRAGLPATDHLLVLPVGGGTVIGGLLFGAGMSLAGMCAAGTLQRLGGGYMLALFVLGGMVAGAALAPSQLFQNGILRAWSPRAWLGDWVGPAPAFLLTAAALAGLWVLIGAPAGRRRGGPAPADSSLPSSAARPGRFSMTAPVVGGVLLAVLNIAQMAAIAPWTVGYPLALAPAMVAGGASESAVRAALPLLALDACIPLGAMAAGARSLRLRWPRTPGQAAVGFVGGGLMGMGIQLAHGCNIGGVFSALPSLSAGSWLYLPSIVVGSWVGTRVLVNLETRKRGGGGSG